MIPFFPSCSPQTPAEAYALCSLLCGLALCLTLHSLLGRLGRGKMETFCFILFPIKGLVSLRLHAVSTRPSKETLGVGVRRQQMVCRTDTLCPWSVWVSEEVDSPGPSTSP